jgi:tetratricopeptide (TPR) repeat protein
LNWVALQALRLGIYQKPLSPVEVVIGSERRQPNTAQSLALFIFQSGLVPCWDVRQSRLLARLYLLNGQPERALDALSCGGQDILSRYLKTLACHWQDQSECRFVDPELARTLMQDGIHDWLSGYPQYGFSLLLLSEQLDQSVRRDKVLMYRLLTEEFYQTLNDRGQALQWSQKWIEAAPEDLDANFFRSGYYIREGQFEKARALLEVAEGYGGQHDWRFGNHMGQVYWAYGNRDRAIEYYAKSYQLNPAEPAAAWYLGSALVAVGRDEEARPYLEIVTHADRSRPYWAHLALAAEEELKRMAQRSK